MHVQPQERTQERSRERKFILERQVPACHSAATWPESKGAPKPAGGEETEREANQGSAFDGGQGGTKAKVCGIYLIHLSVTRPQSGRARRGTLAGPACPTSAHGSFLPEIACSVSLPVLFGPFLSFLSIVPVLLSFHSYPLWLLSCKGVMAGQFSEFTRATHCSPFSSYCGPLALTPYSLFSRTKSLRAPAVFLWPPVPSSDSPVSCFRLLLFSGPLLPFDSSRTNIDIVDTTQVL